MRQTTFTLGENAEESILLPVFPDVESLYVWLTESQNDEKILDKIRNVDFARFKKGDVIVLEWLGCEFSDEKIPDDEQYAESYHYVKFAVFSSNIELVSSHIGWIHNCILPVSKIWEGFNGIISKSVTETVDLDKFFILVQEHKNKKA